MYEVFDFFLELDSWHAKQGSEIEIFNKKLNLIVDKENFDPEKMGQYFKEQLLLNGKSLDGYEHAINHYVANAHAVKEFLQETDR